MTNIRINLIAEDTGELITTVFSPILPSGLAFKIRYADDSEREFWIEDSPVISSVFTQDGPNGLIALSEVDFAVKETFASRIAGGRTSG
jgi:hypothetical protein